MRNLWHQFGLQTNPFFDQPLEPTDNSPYPMRLYVPRGGESNILDRIGSSENSVSMVESLPGGGKTTFINYIKYEAAKAGYLVGPSHVRVMSTFTPTSFALAALFNLLQPLFQAKPKEVRASPRLAEAQAVVEGASGGGGWSFGMEANVQVAGAPVGAGGGLSVGRQRPMREPGIVEHARLHSLLRDVATEARELGYRGCLVHVNNLELAALGDEAWPAQLFNDIRDDLQIPGIHYTIGASRGFVAEHLAGHPRVASILQHPVDLNPLTPDQIRKLLYNRYKALRLPEGEFSEPVSPAAVQRMYSTFNGDLRAMFSAFKDAMERRLAVEPKPVEFEEAVALLRPEYETILRDLPRAIDTATKRLARLPAPFTQADLRKELRKSQPRVSQLFSELQERDIVIQVGGPKPLRYNFSGKAKIALGLAAGSPAS